MSTANMFQLVQHTNSEQSRQSPHLQPSSTPVSTYLDKIPTTRYYGSKRKLLVWLYSKLKSLEFETVLDPFGGTASVSQLFRAMQKKITYHDAFNFNVDVARTLLTDDIALSEKKLTEWLSAIKPVEGIIFNHFKDIFYKDDENAWLDGFMLNVLKLNCSANEKSLLLYLLYQACLKKRPFNLFHRANLNLRTNKNVERSFGNKCTWDRTFYSHIIKAYDELFTSRNLGLPDSTILSSQNANNIASGYDLVYLDPPYVQSQEQRNNDDYWRKYHFLEGLSIYKSWEEKIDSSSRIRLMPTPKHFLTWSRKATFKDALFGILRLHRSSIVVLSYLDNAYPSEFEIKKEFESLFTDVSIHSIEYTHVLSHSKKRELLFVGLP